MIMKTKKRDHITPVLIELHWLPVRARIEFKILLLVYKSMHEKAPHYLRDLLVQYTPERELRSSDKELLVIPRSRLSSMGGRAFSALAPRVWNTLPLSLRNAQTVASFKASLKTHLFQRI